MNRADALKTAEEMVDRLAPKTNARGYSDGTAKLEDRVAAILRLAEFLTTGESVEEVVSGDGYTVRSISTDPDW